jgi:DNA polymerase III epsilon subunit-like protein
MSKAAYTVYDIETTGLSAACQCEIIEFAGIKLDENLNEVDRMHIYIKPYAKIPKKIVELTGITNEKVAGRENRFQALPKIREFIGDTISVCHNAQFDFGFISTMCLQQGLPVLGSYICTMKSYKAITGEKQAKLFMACEKFGIELKNAHTAISDVEATVEVFKKLVELDKENIKSKMHKVTYDKTELYISLMSNIAGQNPNKKVREEVCKTISNNMVSVDVETVFTEFAAGRNPLTICQSRPYNFETVSQLFLIWLNQTRLPKFIYMEDYSWNRQIKGMYEHTKTISEAYELHKKIYETDAINLALYNYLWVKFKKPIDTQTINSAFLVLFNNEYKIEKILEHLPHVSTDLIINAFCDFAENNRETHRDYIRDSLSSRFELMNAIDNKQTFTEDELRNDTRKMSIAISVALYNRNFFHLN